MHHRKAQGFTIIEIILVLAIASLILVVALNTIPRLIAQSHDEQRHDNLITFIDTLKSFQSGNSRGALPTLVTSPTTIDGKTVREDTTIATTDTTWAGFYKNYLPSSFTNPNGDYYDLVVANCNVNSIDAICDANGKLTELTNNSTPDVMRSIYVIIGAYCSGNTALSSSNPRKVSALLRLETADIACLNN